MMPEDSDPDVVKIVIHEKSLMPLIVRQGMAFVTAGLGIEQFQTMLGRVADGAGVSRDEVVVGRIERNQRLLVGCNGAQHILVVHATTEGLHEAALIVLASRDPRHSVRDTGRAISKGLVIGIAACCSRVLTRPSQN